jgi:hypothetical protein
MVQNIFGTHSSGIQQCLYGELVPYFSTPCSSLTCHGGDVQQESHPAEQHTPQLKCCQNLKTHTKYLLGTKLKFLNLGQLMPKFISYRNDQQDATV